MANQKQIILVVEDDSAILFNLQILLKLNDYEVISATDGREALDLIQNHEERPHLILSDIMMPHINGYEFLEAISTDKNYKMIPFIFISAKNPSKDIVEKYPDVLYVPKPINEANLLTIIQEKLGKKPK